jgi:hypothetical protein
VSRFIVRFLASKSHHNYIFELKLAPFLWFQSFRCQCQSHNQNVLFLIFFQLTRFAFFSLDLPLLSRFRFLSLCNTFLRSLFHLIILTFALFAADSLRSAVVPQSNLIFGFYFLFLCISIDFDRAMRPLHCHCHCQTHSQRSKLAHNRFYRLSIGFACLSFTFFRSKSDANFKATHKPSNIGGSDFVLQRLRPHANHFHHLHHTCLLTVTCFVSLSLSLSLSLSILPIDFESGSKSLPFTVNFDSFSSEQLT